jgi:Tol biopolymer transport system component
VYVRDGTLMAVPFDLRGLRVTGPPAAIMNGVMQAVRAGSFSLNETGAAQFSVSNTGVLVYVPSAPVPEQLRSLVWVGRNGTVTPTTVPSGPYGGPRLSPDGKRILMHTPSRGTLIHDLARGGLMAMAPNMWSTFTPDGNQITTGEPSGFVSTSIENGATDHFVIDALGIPHPPGSWSPDGQALLFTKMVANGVWEIRSLSRTGGERKVHAAGNTAINERYPQFSPDGEWFVYSSNERGEEEVFIERYGGAAEPERYAISTNGGTAPAWARSGREIFYVAAAPEGRISMMAVDVTLSPRIVAGRPQVLFEGRYAVGSPHRHYDVSPDGRFLMLQEPLVTPPPPVTHMAVVLNWFEELKRLAPSDR